MKIITADQVDQALRYPQFIDDLEAAFANPHTMPPRQVLQLDPDSDRQDAFAMLPCWNNEVIVQKAFTYFPENQPPHNSLYSQILVFDRKCGEPLALVDGVSVTCWRTAGVSALASRFLSRMDASTLLLLGTGRLAPFLIRAHASVRPLSKVLIWGRSQAKTEALVTLMGGELPELEFNSVTNLSEACEQADIVVCATGSSDILIFGDWIRPGTHTDFLGNHHPTHRECDTKLVLCSRVYVDNRANCLREAGELLVPMSEGEFSAGQVVGELADLCQHRVPGRQNHEDVTLFKSVGCALGDLCGAMIAWKASV